MEIGPNLAVVLIGQEYLLASSLNSTAEAFRNLRLRALETEPSFFSSSYTTESQHLLSFWTKRLQNPQAKTFAVVPTDALSQHYMDSKHTLERPWSGMLVLLGPKLVNLDAYDNASTWKTIMTENDRKADSVQPTGARTQSCSASSAHAYHVVSVYVAPEARGKGLAKKLIKAALASAEQESKERNIRKAICTLGAERDNVAAWRTYESMGFVAVAEDHFTSAEGREFHESIMRRDLMF